MELTREKLRRRSKEIKERTTGVEDYYPASVETWEVRALLDIVEAQEQQLAAAQAEAAKWQRAAERSTELLSKVIACPVDCPVADGCTQDENGFDQCRERLLSWALQPEPETPAGSEEK